MKIVCIFLFLFFGSYSLSAQNEVLEQSMTAGEVVSYGSKEIKFIKVVSDSRCPKDVTCVWAGNAVILVEISDNGVFVEEKEIVLSAAGKSLPLLVVEDSFVLIQNLFPFPETGSNVENREYSLELQVRPK